MKIFTQKVGVVDEQIFQPNWHGSVIFVVHKHSRNEDVLR